MQFHNYTPFNAISWENLNAKNESAVSTLVRIKFALHHDAKNSRWHLKPHSDQGELFNEDIYYGETGKSAVRYESDYVPYKHHTDVVINAHAYHPSGTMGTSWECGVRLFDEKRTLVKEYGLHVKSEKKFYKIGPLWTSLGRDSEREVAIRYEKAFGGTISVEKDRNSQEKKVIKADPYNPIGCGIYTARNQESDMLSPQISYLEKKLKKIPAGFGFINRAWKSRLDFAGTYDQQWIDKQHPLVPKDFNEQYYQGAHPNLIMEGYLQGQIHIELTNLMPLPSPQEIHFKPYELAACLHTSVGDIYRPLMLDTLIIDINDNDTNSWCLYASYRDRFTSPLAITGVDAMLLPSEDSTYGN